jgi:tetratricopeptide (TPR) repeat protein
VHSHCDTFRADKYTYGELKAVGWFRGGYTLMISDLYEEAIDAYNQAIDLDPNVAGFYTMRGYCYSKIEKYKEALEDFNKAIELDPEDAQNYSLRGSVLGIMGNRALAMENIKVAAQLGDKKAQETLKRKGVEW